jgi:hypothetical protein
MRKGEIVRGRERERGESERVREIKEKYLLKQKYKDCGREGERKKEKERLCLREIWRISL